MINFFRNIFEKQVFGVSSWWGNRLGIKASFIRLFFIYAAFTNAFTILIYLVMIFLLKLRYHFKYKKRKSVFDL
ncbi:MAG: PspC domain-containing protein [Bacteroidetes bacterium]|jgi:phage shock protein PspC (stress-responsive transcriptional regulator)|nr:PspC domain-containing protein [Pelagibacterales bacterium]MDA0681749.1 PspC domain-containing protein [Bacteroidota bacterium]MDA0890179.1 PspC domain-containing protein [Bacteroidota bacterium]MDA1009642.1 PspC domain-containing protein [Bacteroidota bacterium]